MGELSHSATISGKRLNQ